MMAQPEPHLGLTENVVATLEEENERLRHLLAEAWGWLGVRPAPSMEQRVDDLSRRIMAEVEELLT